MHGRKHHAQDTSLQFYANKDSLLMRYLRCCDVGSSVARSFAVDRTTTLGKEVVVVLAVIVVIVEDVETASVTVMTVASLA